MRSLVWSVALLMALAGCADDPTGEPGGSDDQDEAPDTDPVDPVDPGTEPSEPDPGPEPGEPSGNTSTGSPPRDPVTWTIDIQGNDFVDGSLTVQVGDSIIWTQRDSVPHTVTADNGEFDSGTSPANRMVQGQTFEYQFEQIGEFPYHCEVHPSMRDTITVVERFDGTPR